LISGHNPLAICGESGCPTKKVPKRLETHFTYRNSLPFRQLMFLECMELFSDRWIVFSPMPLIEIAPKNPSIRPVRLDIPSAVA